MRAKGCGAGAYHKVDERLLRRARAVVDSWEQKGARQFDGVRRDVLDLRVTSPVKPKVQPPAKAKQVCSFCHNVGHTVDECRKRKAAEAGAQAARAPAPPTASASSAPPQQQAKRFKVQCVGARVSRRCLFCHLLCVRASVLGLQGTCNICKQVGHMARDCPTRAAGAAKKAE